MDKTEIAYNAEKPWPTAVVTSSECYGCCGSGGFFVSSDRFIEEHAGEKRYNAAEQKQNISVYGQESNPTTWKLAAMNMAIRGIDFNFGKKNADTLLDDQHPDLRADFVMANPPFNMKEWWNAKLEKDVRWQYGTPPKGNANFAWMQHMIHHLAPKGSMALLSGLRLTSYKPIKMKSVTCLSAMKHWWLAMATMPVLAH